MNDATDRRTAGRTALYRVWGDADRLLYIGISDYFGVRWGKHAKAQPWWGEMRRLTVDAWYDRREDAEEAEAAAIKAEGPKYNKIHVPSAVRVRRDPTPLDQSKSFAGLPKPYRECHCRDPQTRKTLHRNCPKLGEETHGAWYARYTIPPGAADWTPGGNLKRRIGPFISKSDAEEELMRVLRGYQQAGHKVQRLTSESPHHARTQGT